MMRKSTMLTPTKWLQQAFEDMRGEFISEHFDYFIGYEKVSPRGLDLLLYAANILKEADLMRKEELQKGKTETIIPTIYLPLEVTEDISHWDNSYWNELGKDFEPPELYILPSMDLFDIFSQEYKTPIKMPIQGYAIQPLFRSYRTIEDIKNEWEFSNGIYLFCNEDVKKIP